MSGVSETLRAHLLREHIEFSWRCLESPRACFLEACEQADLDLFSIPRLGWLGLHSDLSLNELGEGLAHARIHPLSVAIAEATPYATGPRRRRMPDLWVAERLGLPAGWMEGFKGAGHYCFRGSRVGELPPNLVAQKVSIEGLEWLRAWPEGWAVERLDVRGCPNLASLGPCRYLADLKVWACKGLVTLDMAKLVSEHPGDVGGLQSLQIGHCPNLVALPDPFILYHPTPHPRGPALLLTNLLGLGSLPLVLKARVLQADRVEPWQSQDVSGWRVDQVAIGDCRRLSKLEGSLKADSLRVQDCPALECLPMRLHVTEEAHFSELPFLRLDGQEVWDMKSLELRSAPHIHHLPEGVSVSKYLIPSEVLDIQSANAAVSRGGGRVAGWFKLKPQVPTFSARNKRSFKEEELAEARALIMILPGADQVVGVLIEQGWSHLEALALLAEAAPIDHSWLLAAFQFVRVEPDLRSLFTLMTDHHVHPISLSLAIGEERGINWEHQRGLATRLGVSDRLTKCMDVYSPFGFPYLPTEWKGESGLGQLV